MPRANRDLSSCVVCGKQKSAAVERFVIVRNINSIDVHFTKMEMR